MENRVYASFWRRFAASFLDGLIILIFSYAISFVLNLIIVTANMNSTTSSVLTLIFNLISWIIQIGYYVYFIGEKGQTPGKMALGVMVVNKDSGKAPGYISAFLRETVGKIVSSLVFLIGYFWMIWDKDKQTWHDKIANTVVLYKG